MKLAVASLVLGSAAAFSPSAFSGSALKATSNGSSMDMRYKVAVIGGGPSGACAAEIFAQEKSIDTVLIERKMNNAKPCGGAIPLCMIGEFDLPETTVDRKVGLYYVCFDFDYLLYLYVDMETMMALSSFIRLAFIAATAIRHIQICFHTIQWYILLSSDFSLFILHVSNICSFPFFYRSAA